MSGMRSKREDSEAVDAPADAVEATQELEVLAEERKLEASDFSEAERLELRVRGDLEARGIVGGESARIAELVAGRLLVERPEGYDDLIAGALMVHQARTDLASDLSDSHRELRQLERLMGGFATELRKLDEVLEVLAAYVRRMRGSASENEKQTLH